MAETDLDLSAPDPLGRHVSVGEALAHMITPASTGHETDEVARVTAAKRRYALLCDQEEAYRHDREAAVSGALSRVAAARAAASPEEEPKAPAKPAKPSAKEAD